MIQSGEGLTRPERWRKGECALYLNWDFPLLLPLAIGTPGPQIQTRTYTFGPLALRPLDAD